MTLRKWSDDEINYLINNYKRMPFASISKKIDRSISAINNMRKKLGLSTKVNRRWTDEQRNILFTANHLSDSELAEKLGKSKLSVIMQRQYYRLSVPHSTIARFRTNYAIQKQYHNPMPGYHKQFKCYKNELSHLPEHYKSIFNILINLTGYSFDQITYPYKSRTNLKLSTVRHVAMVLCYLKSPDKLTSVSQLFNITHNVMFHAFNSYLSNHELEFQGLFDRTIEILNLTTHERCLLLSA